MNELLKIVHLNKTFDGVSPVKDISFAIPKQSITLITGENGAGKTTLFNLISGLEKPSKGNIIFNKTDITKKSLLEISKMGITRLYQHPRVFKNLSVWENLVSAAKHKVGDRFFNLILKPKAVKKEESSLREKAFNLLAKFGLSDLSRHNAGELSYGQQKLVSFCMLVINGVKLALLDEPFAGLNPQTIDQFSKMILHMKNEGVTFLIIEHNINKALTVADNHFEMKEGHIIIRNDIVIPA